MARPPPDPEIIDAAPTTALVRATPTALAPAPPAAPPVPVQRVLPAMLPASVAAFGDVVAALLSDLDEISRDVEALAWLRGTGLSLEGEINYQAAMGQLAWWDGFLAALPFPRLLAEHRAPEIQRAKAPRAGARQRALEEARAAHREAVLAEMAGAGDDLDAWERLHRVAGDPQPGEWRVDPEGFVRAALDALPPLVETAPITAADLDIRHNASGYRAVTELRAHPELGPRAHALDVAIAAALRDELGLDKASAAQHAGALTGMFLIALRRALDAGSHQLAASVRLLSQAEQAPVQQRFARELLESWAAYLATMPLPEPKLSLGARLGGLLGRKEPAALPGDGPRLLTADAEPGAWARLRAKLGR